MGDSKHTPGPWEAKRETDTRVSDLLEAARVASQFVAKMAAEGNVFAGHALRNLEAAIAKAEGMPS